MAIQEMHIAVKLGLDKSTALELPAFEPEEIDLWLNEAILLFTKTRYSGNNAKKESFEQTQKRINDLSTLVTDAEDAGTLGLALTTSVDYPNSYVASSAWPTDYMFSVAEEVGTDTVNGVASVNRWGVTQCTFDEYRQKIDDPYSEHILHYNSAKPLRLFDDTNVRLITDSNYTLDRYYLTYIRVPATVDVVSVTTVDCDLPDHTHNEIVSISVDLMLENIEQPRVQTHNQITRSME